MNNVKVVPFFQQKEPTQCATACMKMVLKCFDLEYSFEKLDNITQRIGKQCTDSATVAVTLHELGLSVMHYSKRSLDHQLKRSREQVSEGVLKINMLKTEKSVKENLEYGLFEKRLLSLEEIQECMNRGCIPIMAISSGSNNYAHAVVVTSMRDGVVKFHDPWVTFPDREMDNESFLKLWNADVTDNDVIICSV